MCVCVCVCVCVCAPWKTYELPYPPTTLLHKDGLGIK